ncbi:MAG: AAA family ATPase [Bacteroidetes bacterium]|nr:AAA family ATPase [Bacteroidota bacterium]
MNDYKLSLSNFKSFKNLDDFEILPLTIIVGKNSSGKSSILHSLLLLKQTLNSKYRESRLKLEGQYLEYSNLREMTFGLPALKDCRIGYKFDIKYRNEDSKIEFSFKSKTKGDHQEVVMDSFTQQYKKGRKVESIDYLNLNQKETKSYMKKRLPDWGKFEGYTTKFEHFLPRYFETIRISKNKWKFELPISIVYSKFSMDIHDLKDFISNIMYLSPIRAAPKRAYVHYSDQVQELNDDGSNSAHILWSKRNEIVKWKKRNYKLITAINKCIDQLGLFQNLSPARIKEILYQVRYANCILTLNA